MKSDDNLTDPARRLRDAPRCYAKAKRTGERCKCPAVGGWRVCRVYGAGGGAKRDPANARWKHGGRSREVAEVRALVKRLQRLA